MGLAWSWQNNLKQPFVISLTALNGYDPVVIASNPSIGTAIGMLRSEDNLPNSFGTGYTFELMADPDEKFVIDGNQLKTRAGFNYNAATSHRLLVKAKTVGKTDYYLREFVIPVDAAVAQAITLIALQSAGLTLQAHVPSVQPQLFDLLPGTSSLVMRSGTDSVLMAQRHNLTLSNILMQSDIPAPIMLPESINYVFMPDELPLLQLHNLVLSNVHNESFIARIDLSRLVLDGIVTTSSVTESELTVIDPMAPIVADNIDFEIYAEPMTLSLEQTISIAPEFAFSAPFVGRVPMQVKFDLVAQRINVYPTVGEPLAGPRTGGLTLNWPTVAAPIMRQVHELTATQVDADEPEYGTPAAVNLFSFTIAPPFELITNVPTVGAPDIDQDQEYMTGGVRTEAPVLRRPVIKQTHIYGVDGVVTNAPTIPDTAITQTHAFDIEFALSAPEVSAPVSLELVFYSGGDSGTDFSGLSVIDGGDAETEGAEELDNDYLIGEMP